MYSLTEVDLGRDHEDVVSVDCQSGVLAILYTSGEVVVKDIDDERSCRFETWVKNPHKVFVHPQGHYVMVACSDGLVHFFSAVEPSLRCTAELSDPLTDLRNRTLIGETLCWLTPVGESSNSKLVVLLGTLSLGICFQLSFQFLSHSIKPSCVLLARLEIPQSSLPIRSIYYADYGGYHILVLSTAVHLLYCFAPSKKSEFSAFLEDVKNKKFSFSRTSCSPQTTLKDKTLCGDFRVFVTAENCPRSFCWTNAEGVVHGLFEIAEGSETFFTKLHHVEAAAFRDSSVRSSDCGKLCSVVPTSSHMIFLLQKQCFAVQHPAGIPWRTSERTGATTIQEIYSSSLLDFDSKEDSSFVASGTLIKAIISDSSSRRSFLVCSNRIWELTLHQDKHRLWKTFIEHGSDAGENERLRERFFSGSLKVASTTEEINTSYYLYGFFLIVHGRHTEGVESLAKCDFFDDILLRLRAHTELCDLFLEKRFLCMADAYNRKIATLDDIRQIVFLCFWWKITQPLASKKSVENFIDVAFEKSPNVFERSKSTSVEGAFSDDLVKLFNSNEQSECAVVLHMKMKNYSAVINFFLEHGNKAGAVDTLIECDPKESRFTQLWYDFLPELITHSPVKLLSSLRKSLAKAHRLKIVIDMDPFLPSFLKYDPSHHESASQIHQVKALMNSLIYNYDCKSRAMHNYYVFLLANCGDEEHLISHLKTSKWYDLSYAMHLCIKYHFEEAMIVLYRRLGFWGDILRMLLPRVPQVEKSVIAEVSLHLDDAQVKSIWKDFLVKQYSKCGAVEALASVERSGGILDLEELLHSVKDDSTAVETLKGTICKKLDYYSSSCVNHASLYSTSLQAVAITKYQLQEVQQEVSYISSTQKCALCGTPLIGRASSYEPYLVYRTCRHAVHEVCAVKEVNKIGLDAFKGIVSLEERCDSEERLAAADCVICGEAAILLIGIPL